MGKRMIDAGLQDKVALITGTNNPLGIGAATARALAEQGTRVFLAFMRKPGNPADKGTAGVLKQEPGGPSLYEAMQRETPEKLGMSIRASGGRVAWQEEDLAATAAIPRLFDSCEESFGPVDILVNNHAHWAPETFDPTSVSEEGFGMRLMDESTIESHFAVNTRATALLMAEYLKRHLRRGASWGRIINVSTDAADAHAGAVSYAASKHAVESFSRSAAHELGKYGITVNTVAPGPVQTGWLTPEEEADIGRRTPLGRAGRPDDIADVIVFLASEQARWLTGQLIFAGGGWKMPL
jgi:3-oxoacyl-[acyl-carrier protein] reductase